LIAVINAPNMENRYINGKPIAINPSDAMVPVRLCCPDVARSKSFPTT
jgi:hypothetical protein